MIDFPVLAWVARPLMWVFRFVWSVLRIKDGSFISLTCIGDTEESRPEFLYIGLQETKHTCLVRLFIAVENKGRAPIRNLIVSVHLPQNLAGDVTLERTNPDSSDVFYTTKIGRRNIVFNFETSLRIDEGAGFPIFLRVRPNDWIEVKAGEPHKKRVDLVDYLAVSPVRVAAIRMDVAARADNIRSVSRKWDIWLTPAESWDELKERLFCPNRCSAYMERWAQGIHSPLLGFSGFYAVALGTVSTGSAASPHI